METTKKWYPNINMWWVRHCKKRLRNLLQQEEAGNRRNLRIMENQNYECIYDIKKTDKITPTSTAKLKLFKVKILRLRSQKLGETMHDAAPADCINGEHPTLYQLVKRQKRQTSRLVRSVGESNGNIQTITATYRL
jgi:hypothetical protein